MKRVAEQRVNIMLIASYYGPNSPKNILHCGLYYCLNNSDFWFHKTCQCLTFMCPCTASIIINGDQQDATIFDLFISSLLYTFRATLSPIIRSTQLYLQLQVLSTDIARWDGTPSHPRYQPATISVDSTWSCKYSYVLLMMGEGVARNM
jgi:hypothetical protein